MKFLVLLLPCLAAVATGTETCVDSIALFRVPPSEDLSGDYRLTSAVLSANGWSAIPLFDQNSCRFNTNDSEEMPGWKNERNLIRPLVIGVRAAGLFYCSPGLNCGLGVVAESRDRLAAAWHLEVSILYDAGYPSAAKWLEGVDTETHKEFALNGGYAYKSNYTYGHFRALVRPEVDEHDGAGTELVHLGRPREEATAGGSTEAEPEAKLASKPQMLERTLNRQTRPRPRSYRWRESIRQPKASVSTAWLGRGKVVGNTVAHGCHRC
mmetsp:Transcript_24211/g.35392  ORF Transcript_24211/g.35392 Transcript_24211/m.35392 type:complete len:267 (+) Transcript_24211:175-975(+)